MFHGVSINSIASFQYVAGEARSPLRPWLTELWGKACTICRPGRQPCRASGGGSPWSKGRQRWSHNPEGCVGDRQLHLVDKAGDTAWSCGWGLDPEADKGAYWMSLYLGHAPCWMVAPFWEVLVNLPSWQSWATPVGCCLPPPGWLFMPSGHNWCCWTGVFPQPVLFWKHWHSAFFPFYPARQTSFSIPLSCCSSLGSESFGGLEYHQGGGCTAWALAPWTAPWPGVSMVRWLCCGLNTRSHPLGSGL